MRRGTPRLAPRGNARHTCSSHGGDLAASPQSITEALERLDLSDPAQANALLALVYDELRAIARRQMRGEREGHTLEPTALVHEAYLRLVGGGPIAVEGRAHFFRLASRAMRQVLVDAARRRNADRRGGDFQKVTLDSGLVADERGGHDLLGLHEALERLGALDPALERLVEMRFFTGLTLEESADALGVSRRKAAKDWAAARLWLRRELEVS
jgi:RNA polymerase sigma factor (TIGR02999 family)